MKIGLVAAFSFQCFGIIRVSLFLYVSQVRSYQL